ncbi:hypothetical protein HNR16_001786 [Pseudoclavibacter chungangensis]|uniref:DUF1844 domain-containing protein n=1 Tax=Pseudoclavibacter chungangensis TaxID=587635 RepID=UPI001827C2FA|nr:DUF1844 domain-containing protein [Pseudoclavibacter chungangensis]NYJ66998.1 hypothetical protein [Pseudoclavibacter chungangensis]
MSQSPTTDEPGDAREALDDALRDIGDVPAVELITTTAVHLMSAAAVKCGLGELDGDEARDLDEARKLISALAGLLTASLPYLGDHHARPLRDGLRSLQLAFREASPYPDPVGKGPGEDLTGPVYG